MKRQIERLLDGNGNEIVAFDVSKVAYIAKQLETRIVAIIDGVEVTWNYPSKELRDQSYEITASKMGNASAEK